MSIITRVFKKTQAFNGFYIQFLFNSWFNDRKLIEYLNENENKNIEIGIGSDIDKKTNTFKNTDNANITFIDNQTEIIVNLDVKDIYKNYDIKLNLQGGKFNPITNPYYTGDDTIVDFNKVGFYLIEKEKYVNSSTFSKKNQKRYEIKTYNDYDFIYLEKPNILIPMNDIKDSLFIQNKISIALTSLDKLSLNKRDYSYDKKEDCVLSFNIIHSENRKEAEFSVYHNSDIEDLELTISASGYTLSNRFCENIQIAVGNFLPDIEFILVKKNGEADTRISSLKGEVK